MNERVISFGPFSLHVEQLIARAWPQTYVEESNLKIQMSALRRTLGDGQGGNRYIVTVPGRGYSFVAPVRREEPSQTPLLPTARSAPTHNLPFAATRMIGREESEAAVVSQLSQHRLVTIVGPGGRLRPWHLHRPYEATAQSIASSRTAGSVATPLVGKAR